MFRFTSVTEEKVHKCTFFLMNRFCKKKIILIDTIIITIFIFKIVENLKTIY